MLNFTEIKIAQKLENIIQETKEEYGKECLGQQNADSFILIPTWFTKRNLSHFSQE